MVKKQNRIETRKPVEQEVSSITQKSIQENQKTDIAYQNKDIVSKLFGENLKNKSFSVYGLDVPKIVDVLPTNLPAIEANELRLDNLFLLEDGSLALVDYESSYTDESKIKYLNYIIRTLKRNLNQNQIRKKIRMIVIYTGDIKPEQTRPRLDIGCLQFELEEAFLWKFNSEKEEAKLKEKVRKAEHLSDEDQMKMMILPLTYPGKEQKRECIRRCFQLTKEIQDSEVQRFILSGMLVFVDKVVTIEDSKQMKEWIMMTKVGQLFEEEKVQYGKEMAEKAEKNAEKNAREKERKLTEKLLARGDSVEDVADLMEILTREEIEKIAKENR